MTSLLLNSMDTFLSSSYQRLCRIWHGWPLSPSWKFLLPWFLWQHLLLGFLLSGQYFSVYFPWFCLLLTTLQTRDHQESIRSSILFFLYASSSCYVTHYHSFNAHALKEESWIHFCSWDLSADPQTSEQLKAYWDNSSNCPTDSTHSKYRKWNLPSCPISYSDLFFFLLSLLQHNPSHKPETWGSHLIPPHPLLYTFK